MTAVKTRRRKVTKPKPPVLGKVTWAILRDGEKIRENGYGSGANLAMAQHMLGNGDEPGELHIERRDLFGPAAMLYRVVRDEEGNVTTEIISQED